MGNGKMFSGALLPFSPEVAGRVQSVLASVPDNMRQMMQELVDSGEIDDLPDNMDEQALAAVNYCHHCWETWWARH